MEPFLRALHAPVVSASDHIGTNFVPRTAAQVAREGGNTAVAEFLNEQKNLAEDRVQRLGGASP